MSNISIAPSPKFVKFLKEILRIEQRKLKKLDNFPTTVRNNDEKKVRWLDNLFTSMANLIYFFEFINKNPELMARFGEDIEDLLGLIPHKDSKYGPFERLTREVIGEGYSAAYSSADTNFTYQTRLLYILQFLVKQRSDWIMMQLHEPPTKNDYEMRNLMIEDMKRAEVWMGYLDKFDVDKKRKPNRVLGF